MKNFRPKVLEKYKQIWLTKEGHKALRRQKPKQKKSMMQLLEDLIKEKYGVQ